MKNAMSGPVHIIEAWSGIESEEAPMCGAWKHSQRTAYPDKIGIGDLCPDCATINAVRSDAARYGSK